MIRQSQATILFCKYRFFSDENNWSDWMASKAMGRLSGHGFSLLASITEKMMLSFIAKKENLC